MLGEQPLQVGLDAVLDQAGVDAELVGGVVQHLVDEHPQAVLGLGVLHLPDQMTPSAASCSSGETSAIAHGGDIQFSGLYEPPSLCTSTDPSALTSSSRVARGRWAVRRPS